ncbi:hypothetical protein AGABI2DRAFT_190938 [Agaricus bisporus var. bisporus H97]|uniref:hypothetical protein n=1 Tax=Agaricus bisporus var. bisporus (strain H97 / ATCC MYA-4626 / FGSC 10389) TaxID=936046 RepID=UPI00029F674D|nr:hypothetical protein AGABI2DRAFT_190938 [Agaricus bisporus var. bisporus H97]EKV50698.1 hypothetical protein AGABI2DRAFT_190938 [Agaricus bisporus var. bisporus H97]
MDEEDEDEEEEELEETQEEEIDGEVNDNEEDQTDSILCDAHLSEADVHRMIYEAIKAMNPATAPGVVNERRGIIGEGSTVTRRVNRNMEITLEDPLGPPSSPSNTSRKGLYHCL